MRLANGHIQGGLAESGPRRHVFCTMAGWEHAGKDFDGGRSTHCEENWTGCSPSWRRLKAEDEVKVWTGIFIGLCIGLIGKSVMKLPIQYHYRRRYLGTMNHPFREASDVM